jgi:hypothetical protein
MQACVRAAEPDSYRRFTLAGVGNLPGWVLFASGNAKKLLGLVQLILRVALPFPAKTTRPKPTCPQCGQAMNIISIIRPHWQAG